MKKNYWERLKIFKLYSNQRRNERYKILYIWKSLYNMVPSLDLKWSETCSKRVGPKLEVDRIYEPNEMVKNLKRDSLKNFGVRLFNMLPVEVRTYQGSLENFKKLLDSYISQCPDQPATEDMKPEAKDIYGNNSNSLIDWMRVTQFVDPSTIMDKSNDMEEAQPCP